MRHFDISWSFCGVGAQLRSRLTNNDRWFFIQLYRWYPSILQVITMVQPGERGTLASGWLCAAIGVGNRGCGEGSPDSAADLHALIRRMSIDNPLWGAPRSSGELLKLGFEVAQSSVAKYMVKRHGPPVRDGAPFCVTTRRTLPPWICSLSQPSL